MYYEIEFEVIVLLKSELSPIFSKIFIESIIFILSIGLIFCILVIRSLNYLREEFFKFSSSLTSYISFIKIDN